MSRRPKTQPRRAPRQKRAEDTVVVLLQATERVLARHGYEGSTTNRIAEAAGVGIATLYRYFPSKEALIEALVHDLWAEELRVVARHVEAMTRGPFEPAMRAAISDLVGLVARRRETYARWYSEASNLGRLELAMSISAEAIGAIRRAFEVHRAFIRPSNLDFAADFVVKMVIAAVRAAPRDYVRELDDGELARELGEMIVRYLRKDAP